MLLIPHYAYTKPLYVIMKEETQEEKFDKYWKNIEKKTNSVIEVLKGVSYQEIQQILTAVKEKTEDKVRNSIIY